MAARYARAILGLPAITIVVAAGLITRNAVTMALSRSIFAFFLCCLIGLVLGRIAQEVVAEHEHKRETEILKRYHGMRASNAVEETKIRSTARTGGSIAS